MGLSLKGILSTIAPTMAGLLPGPLGGMAKSAITSLLGMKPEASETEIEKVLATANPDILLKLKQLDSDFQVKLAELDIDIEKLMASDRADARSREVSLKDKTPRILAAAVIGGYMILQFFVLRGTIPPANHDIVVRSLSILEAAVVMVLAYYFGSSAGSARKDNTIKELSR